jgi:hypothetical protein
MTSTCWLTGESTKGSYTGINYRHTIRDRCLYSSLVLGVNKFHDFDNRETCDELIALINEIAEDKSPKV